MNYVTVIYLLNQILYLIYFGVIKNEMHATNIDFFVSGATSLLLIFAGYLNAKKGLVYRTVLWFFFINVLLFIMSGLFDQFGSHFSIPSTSNSNSSAFTFALMFYNAYIFLSLSDTDLIELVIFIITLAMSFILPSLGFVIGARLKSHSEK